MSGKNKAVALAVLFLALNVAAGGCSTAVGGKSDRQVVAADDGEVEEVLSDESRLDDLGQDEFGRPLESSPDSGAGGVLVSLGYLGLMIGSALLPYLLLL